MARLLRRTVEVAGEGAASDHAGDGRESWKLVDAAWVPVAAAERYLAHLAGIEHSPNTVWAYAHGLRLCFEFFDLRSLEGQGIDVEEVSRFVARLRAPADNVIVLDDTAAVRGEIRAGRGHAIGDRLVSPHGECGRSRHDVRLLGQVDPAVFASSASPPPRTLGPPGSERIRTASAWYRTGSRCAMP